MPGRIKKDTKKLYEDWRELLVNLSMDMEAQIETYKNRKVDPKDPRITALDKASRDILDLSNSLDEYSDYSEDEAVKILKESISDANKIMDDLNTATKNLETSDFFKKFINSAVSKLEAFAEKLGISKNQENTVKKDPFFKTKAYDLSEHGKTLLTGFEKRKDKVLPKSSEKDSNIKLDKNDRTKPS